MKLHMHKIRIIDIVALVVFFIGVRFIVVLHTDGLAAMTHNRMRECVISMNEYIRSHDGNLPSDVMDLYKLKYGSSFEKFRINLDFDLDKVVLAGYKLYDKETGEQILIIDGSLKSKLRKEYELASFDLYNEVIRLRNNSKEKGR